MSTYTTADLHTSADKVLEIIKTIPTALKMSENAGNWIGLEDLRNHIRKSRKLYIDDQTLDILIGLLIGRNEIECIKHTVAVPATSLYSDPHRSINYENEVRHA